MAVQLKFKKGLMKIKAQVVTRLCQNDAVQPQGSYDYGVVFANAG